LAVLPPVAWAIRFYAVRVRAQSTTIRERESDLLAVAQEGLGQIRMVHAFGRESFEVDQFRQRASRSLEANMRLAADDEARFDAVRNATVVREAERYYRAMYRGARESWNLRDRHMFETLEALLARAGPDAKAVVWAHNSHVGNASATEMGMHGEINLGQLARERFGDGAYIVGFGTDHGTVAAAANWDAPMRVMPVRPSHEDSYERLCHESGRGMFMLPLRNPHFAPLRTELLHPRLERAIGVIYRPATELVSHYFQATLPAQFDEYIWIDETRAIEPLPTQRSEGTPETYPFAL
jgi:protein-L-isoaspartate(D-aspartate) O-methyltransferase